MKRLAISTSSSIGDLIVTLPYLNELKRRFPSLEIYHIPNNHRPYTSTRLVYGESGLIDGTLSIFKEGQFSFITNLYFQRARANLMRWNCAVIVETGLLADRVEIKRSIIQRSLRMKCPIICESAQNLKEQSQPSGKKAVLGQIAACLPEFEKLMPGIKLDALNYRMPFSKREVEACEHELKLVLSLDQVEKYYTLGLGGTLSIQKWPLPNYVQVVRHLYKTKGLVPVVVGGPDDESACRQIADAVPATVSMLGRNLRTALYAIGKCRFYFGNDTGTLHMANAMGLPCIGLYGWNDVPGAWYPFGRGHLVFQSEYGKGVESIEPENVIRHLSERDTLVVEDRSIPFDFYCSETVDI